MNCYRDASHQQCVDEFEEKELLRSMNLDESNSESTTTNEFVRQRIDEILKRKLEEKELHDENDDENVDELFNRVFTDEPTEPLEEDAEERIPSDDENEEPVPDLPDDFDDSDEKTGELWNMLTSDEKREFQSMLKDGRISHLLNDYKPWKPWWLYKAAPPSLVTSADTPTEPVKFPETIPSVASAIVPLPSLTSILPHVHVRFDLFEILFAYALMNIRYRGEFSSYLVESGNEFLRLAGRHFAPPSAFDDLQTRIALLREEFSFRISEEFFVNLLADVRQIVNGPYPRGRPSNLFVLSALSDLKTFLAALHDFQPPVDSPTAEKNVFHQHRTPTRTTKTKKTKLFPRKTLQNLRRKIDYLLSWTISHADRLLILHDELEATEKDLRRRLNDYQREKSRIEANFQKIRVDKSTNSKSRIEEL